MALSVKTLYISIAGPPPELPDIGPGSSGGGGSAGQGSVLGQTYTVGTSSNASASLELRVQVVDPTTNSPTGANVNTSLGGSLNVWTSQDLWQALDKLKYFIRQRGFILGSGGPGFNAANNLPQPD